MHILDVFKPRRRGLIQRRKSQGSILGDTSTELWDPWVPDPHAASNDTPALPSQQANTPAFSDPPPSPPTERWNVVDPSRRTQRANTTGPAPVLSGDYDTISVHSDTTRHGMGVPHVQRQPEAAWSSRTSSPALSSPAPSFAPTYLPLESPDMARETSGSRMRAPPSVPVLRGTPVHQPTQRSMHGSVHRPSTSPRSRELHALRNASPSPTISTMSSSIVHTLENGTKIHVPTSPSPERGRSPARLTDAERDKRRTFYIVPPGMNVIFTDDHGTEIARVGEFNVQPDPVRYHESPIVLKDEQGRVIYQTIQGDRTAYDVDDEFHGDRPNVIHLGNFVPKSSWSIPITVSLDERGHEMIIYDSKHKSGAPAPLPSSASHSSSRVTRVSRPPPARARSTGTLYSNSSVQSTPSLTVGSWK